MDSHSPTASRTAGDQLVHSGNDTIVVSAKFFGTTGAFDVRAAATTGRDDDARSYHARDYRSAHGRPAPS